MFYFILITLLRQSRVFKMAHNSVGCNKMNICGKVLHVKQLTISLPDLCMFNVNSFLLYM